MEKSQASTFQDLHDFTWYVLQPATPRDSNSTYNHFTFAEEMVFKQPLVDTDRKVLLSSESSLQTASFSGHFQGCPTTLGWRTPPAFTSDLVSRPLQQNSTQILSFSHFPDVSLTVWGSLALLLSSSPCQDFWVETKHQPLSSAALDFIFLLQ